MLAYNQAPSLISSWYFMQPPTRSFVLCFVIFIYIKVILQYKNTVFHVLLPHTLDKDNLNILSANVRGFRKHFKKIDVLDYMNKFKPDMICVQETHLIQKDSKCCRKSGISRMFWQETPQTVEE